jgi:predicted O-methyltransferase YrrM
MEGFEEIAGRLRVRGMGTERVAPLLAALVRLLRPQTVLELGAGYTTLFLLRALAEATDDRRRDVDTLASGDDTESGLLLPHAVEAPYDPVLISVDDLSDPFSSATEVAAAAGELGLDRYLRLVNASVAEAVRALAVEGAALDLLWLDAGDLRDEALVVRDCWPLLADGGLLVFHDAYLTLPVLIEAGDSSRRALRRVPGPLANELRRQLVDAVQDPGFELLGLVEPHKHRQGSVGILRKLGPAERLRAATFDDEAERVLRRPLDVQFDLARTGKTIV